MKNEIPFTGVRSKPDNPFGNPESLFESIRNNAGYIIRGCLIEKESAGGLQLAVGNGGNRKAGSGSEKQQTDVISGNAPHQ